MPLMKQSLYQLHLLYSFAIMRIIVKQHKNKKQWLYKNKQTNKQLANIKYNFLFFIFYFLGNSSDYLQYFNNFCEIHPLRFINFHPKSILDSQVVNVVQIRADPGFWSKPWSTRTVIRLCVSVLGTESRSLSNVEWDFLSEQAALHWLNEVEYIHPWLPSWRAVRVFCLDLGLRARGQEQEPHEDHVMLSIITLPVFDSGIHSCDGPSLKR